MLQSKLRPARPARPGPSPFIRPASGPILQPVAAVLTRTGPLVQLS
ncbi:hypothetical protein OROGR_017241 [Orobanche gracilis]